MTAPLRRRGPRPLPLHLGLAGLRALAATSSLPGTPWLTAWRNSNAAWPISKAGQAERDRILAALAAAGHGPEAFGTAVLNRLARADRAMIGGLAAYRRHPWQRRMTDPPAIWTEGGSRLLDFGGDGLTVLFVPSLVNRAYVLDLTPRRSLMRWLPGQGYRTLLLDWGWPGEAERTFTLTDYVAGRLERALMAAPGPVVLAGYCMGGLLALAAALRRPDRVRALALLATPWDFHAGPDGPRRARTAAALLPGLETMMAPTEALPVDAIQSLFALLDPFGIAQKFRAFARLDPQSERAELFVALEDWLNDGIPLPAPVARQCLAGWYGRNEPGRLAWHVAGQVVDPAGWDGPAFAGIPHRDRIVPPESALAAALRLRDVKTHLAPAGHISMVAGGGAETALWHPFRAWLDTVATPA
ncbi:alpha/beta fold hydrolase [Roseomonas sp. JC162]|uniref:Alpha/beta fold hydrolase n=1 Tax=Neoroseomonas marina TaxID=1232220 RepID=A0A848EKC3_9PROT|nr:alpha/beta fold hydrolase [Neoroseomonas marina]NMJ44396.1 alpha/beta fold hydrolase [Neoroseomonas marina]